ncbi:cobaltochelatase subunit CobN [Devosia sp. XJ19-1]|uniref:Cobaltochelatase subunit CobN n=1 Tax=Devosia ureilytica TaxID=2952754 RepID=A0A9Q4ARQ6_9HYPH|nr:cobaltochelatase subunit CobN [Devosia ureilytica]MCP8884908.1 cobaltochelatase subunit CobN [Devosia ureilytica]MCP8888581.1 cobaltochelatase subunit CobN [Devosia ureilytica]
MHLLSAQAGAIQQEGEAIDLAQTPGDYVFASSADSELAMLAGATDRAGENSLRLANTLRLSNNLSVDMWLERTVAHARLVVLRLIGGAAYFQYGVDELTALCASRRIPLVLLPGDANPDPILQSRSTIHSDDWSTLHALFIAGGPDNADAILQAFRALTSLSPLPLGERSAAKLPGEGALLVDSEVRPFPRFGLWHPSIGMTDEPGLRTLHSSPHRGEVARRSRVGEGGARPTTTANGRAHIPILFYRAALEGAGTATLEALIAELEARGLAPVPLLVSSLKEPACVRFVQNALAAFPPSAIFNLTAFALGIADLDDKANPFSGTDAPVIQLIQSGRSEAQWAADPQGLSSKDMAMYLVMPEVDGRIGGLLVGHKADAVWHERTQCPLSAYAPDLGGISRAVDLAFNWARLRATPRAERHIAMVLANYPIRDGRLANGVGYDAAESTVRMLMEMEKAGYDLGTAAPPPPSPPTGGTEGGGAEHTEFSKWGAGHDNSRLSRQAKNVERSRTLRSGSTPPERVLWSLLRQSFKEHHFRRQVPIGSYFADFASHRSRLVIELDGDTHGSDQAQAHDARRDAFLQSAGYRVLRIGHRELANLEGLWSAISEALISGDTPTPDPSPQGGGEQSPTRAKLVGATGPKPLPLEGRGWGGGVEHSGYPTNSADLIAFLQSGPTNANPQRGTSGAVLPLTRYSELFIALPEEIRGAVTARWGDPSTDPFIRDNAFHLPAHRFGNIAILLQPARGWQLDETASYHDPNLVPPHAYVAAYLWLRHEFGAQALIHNGKHGTLEWLPGKSAALDADCYPDALWGQLPHLYPFIVNDPGEGTQAKRRTGAVIIDHLVPPLTRAETYGPLKDLEALLDEYYAASGMDRRRLNDLKRRILDFTRDSRLDQDIGLPQDETAALIKIDNFLCDLKEAQIRDGLHIFGQSPTGALQRDLTVALARIPRGESPGDNSLIRALADDLKLGFDPLTARLGDRWTGPRIDHPNLVHLEKPGLPPGSMGDVVEHLEMVAADLVSGALTCPQDWIATRAVLETVQTLIQPRLAASGPAEMQAFLDALDGKFIAPGPSGAPSRGRLDVLPTGRNFYSVDARAIPTPSAWELGRKSAESLVLRHLQDHGHHLAAVALSVWGTANMRTGGDDIAQALALIGARPTWDPGSLRVSGYEIIPLAKLGRPRVDVTLRISGFFRDAFPAQIALFDRAARAIGALDEPAEDNPIAARMRAEALGLMAEGKSESDASLEAGARIFGSKPGTYGAGLGQLIDNGSWSNKADLANQALAWGQYAYGAKATGLPMQTRFATRLGQIDAVIHNQDNREHDLLDSDNYYQYEGGLSVAAETLTGHKPAAYHNDHSRPEQPKIRTLDEEISHVMRSRVVNPKWLAGMMRHGYRGAFEIIATVDFMFAFAATTGAVKTHHFDLAFEAFVEDDTVRDFLIQANRFGYDELIAKFLEARQRGLWSPRSNSVFAYLEPSDD